MTGYGWLVMGTVIGLGHWVASALPVIGAVCLALAVPVAAVAGIAAWAVRRERRLELLIAAELPDITTPLTVYEEAVFALLTGTQDNQDNRSSE